MTLPRIGIWFVIFVVTFLPQLTWAAAAENGSIFNPNFIISDEELQDWKSMSRADIQAFLEDQEGYIAEYRTEDVQGKKRKVSDIIYRAAKGYQINPKYLLVKLQKEQSLVNDPDPTQKQLDWATGYGVCDSCKTTDEKIQKYKGFGTQMDNAAGIMRWYYDHVDQESWIKRPNITYAIDNTNVEPASYATAFLYTYTPHIHGNENFWNLWQKWFTQIYPDGTLLKSAEDSTTYLLQQGKRRAFKNMAALTTRYDPKLVITVPTSEITRYEQGEDITLANYSVLKEGTTYYLLDYDTLRPFTEEVRKKLGFNPDEIIVVDETILGGYMIGKPIEPATTAPLGELIRLKENKQLYYVKDNIYHSVYDDGIAKVNYPGKTITAVPASYLSSLEAGPEVLFQDGTLFGITGQNKIYVVENGKKRHIASEEVFNGLGYRWENIAWVNEFAGMAHPTGQAIYIEKETTKEILTTLSEETVSSPDAVSETEPVKDDTGAFSPQDAMVTTRAEQTEILGPKFDTAMDAYLIADAESGTILAGKNIDTVRPIASFTKVMTAYELLKEGLVMNKTVTYDSTKHKELYHHYRIADGEKVLNKDLLDALLVSSLNTPARMLVNSVTSDEALFIKNMNAQAKKLGLSKTTFVDTSGVRAENVSTAREFRSE